jgi:pectinesterase
MRSLAFLALALPLHAAELVVAADGSAPFKTVQSAVDAAAPRAVIHIKPGTYREVVVVPPDKHHLTFRGDDATTTIISFDLHTGVPGPDGKPINTFGSPTVFVQADDFTAEHITFANTAGRQGQAVALTIMGDRGVFRDCRFTGYQDTLLPQAGRQYFERCYIEGAVDFIFGGSAAWFEECEIHVTANGYITAANTTKNQRCGYVFHKCKITGEPGVRTFLGRPWRPWAATVFLDTQIVGDVVRPEGWNNWNDPTREQTVRYAEYGSGGPERVAWARKLTGAEAKEYTIANVLGGLDAWDPKAGTVRGSIQVAKGTVKPAAIPKGSVWYAGIMVSTDGLTWIASASAPPAKNARTAAGPDGMLHAVWTTGDKKLWHATAQDPAHWSAAQSVEIMADQNALDLESPNLFYDEPRRQWIVTWSCTLARNAIQAFQEDVNHNPRIWYATTADFQTFSEPKLLFDNNYATRDAQIIHTGWHYILLHNDNSRPMQNLRAAIADTPTGPWGPSTTAFTPKFTEVPTAIRIGDEWRIYWGGKARGLYVTRDFIHFTDASAQLKLPAGDAPLGIVILPANTPPPPRK